MCSIEATYRPRQKDVARGSAPMHATATLHVILCAEHAEKTRGAKAMGWDYWDCLDSIEARLDEESQPKE